MLNKPKTSAYNRVIETEESAKSDLSAIWMHHEVRQYQSLATSPISAAMTG